MPEPRPLTGVALMLAALFCFALLDATSKHLSQIYSVPLLVWARYTLHCLMMVIVLAPSMRMKLVATKKPLAQMVRGTLLVAVTGFAMAAFRIMPLAEATALLFVAPLFVVLLAGPLLGERAGPLRWLAVLAGFGGTLLIARPGSSLSFAGVALALTAAACYSIYQIQTRRLSATESTVTMLFYTALMGTLVMTLGLPWFWGGPMPTALDALMIASLGLYGGTGHFLLIRAFRHAPASTLSPFQYTQLIWATFLGWAVYGQLPDALSMVGMVIVVGSGLLVALAERRRHVASAQRQ
jgi:drug/metabolite transporter (DMT)-like permease